MAESAGTDDGHIKAALESVKQRVAAASAERGSAHATRLVAVSKTKPVSDLMAAYDAGQRIFGENYVQELIDKAPQMPEDVQWHFIGHLQSKKANGLVAKVPNLVAVETVDDDKIASKLNSACAAAGRASKLQVYLQVDTSGEETKSGVDPEGAPTLAKHVVEDCPNLELKGLMTIGAPDDFECFNRLAACRHEVAEALGVDAASLELSMGMSGDFEEAIARGSTSVRVGSTIFGARNYANK
ncbi:hypothetical protein JKP88DRAFT_269998 [Tribonema minus]|uniref:Pyridoxal phosphate homeostasis protein n=1 Tax=Tribonema minus TaxID=303371 RepID=A0A835YW12_9STRA|nr:hypothetical protein JKP88DRAFT_269998 [Tribonema minus]